MSHVLSPVVQNRITAFWFKGKELALAFGLTLAFSRLGSVLNFFLTQKFEESYGMQWTLWGGRLEDKLDCVGVDYLVSIVKFMASLVVNTQTARKQFNVLNHKYLIKCSVQLF